MTITKRTNGNKAAGNVEIKAAASTGKTFAAITLDQIIDTQKLDGNPWIAYAFETDGFNAFTDDALLYSEVIDDVLYLCVNTNMVTYMDREYEAEELLDSFPVEQLQDFIYTPSDSEAKTLILDYIDEDTIKAPNFNKLAPDIINEYDFTDLVDGYEAFGME